MATKKIKLYHSGLPSATAPTDSMSVISTDGSADKQIPLESLATYTRGKLTDLDRVQDSLGSYTERPSITLTPLQTDKAISADGTLVTKSGWAIAQFTAELGNEYLFKPGETSADVCVFAEKVDKVETRAIDYAYTYGSDGKVSTATATYNGKTYTYTYTYASDGSATITDASGNVVTSLPSVYTTTVGSYQPMTRLNAGAELPTDGYCRFVSNFQAASSITVVVSYKVGSADLTMRVLRDGMTASMCTQLSKINQKVDNVAASVPKMWMRLLSTKDTWVSVNGVATEIKAHKNYRFTDVKSFSPAVNGKDCHADAITYIDIHYNDIQKVANFPLHTSAYDADGYYKEFFCSNLRELDSSGWDTSSWTDLSQAYRYCRKLEHIDVSGWDTSNVRAMDLCFNECFELKRLDVSGWNTSKVTTIRLAFCACRTITELDLSSFDLTNATNIDGFLTSCHSLTDITFGEGFGKATASGLTIDLSTCGTNANYQLTDNTYNTLLTLYDRATAGLPTMTIKFSTKHNIPDGFVDKMTARGYTITTA